MVMNTYSVYIVCTGRALEDTLKDCFDACCIAVHGSSQQSALLEHLGPNSSKANKGSCSSSDKILEAKIQH